MPKAKRGSKKDLSSFFLVLSILLSLIVAIGTILNGEWVQSPLLLPVLIVLGLVIGWKFKNIKERHSFLMGVVAIIVSARMVPLITLDQLFPESNVLLGTFLSTTLGVLAMLLGVAGLVVGFFCINDATKE